MKCVQNKFLPESSEGKEYYWMLANVLTNIKYQQGDARIRNDEGDCFNKRGQKSSR